MTRTKMAICLAFCLGPLMGGGTTTGTGGGTGGGAGGTVITKPSQATDALLDVMCGILTTCDKPMAEGMGVFTFATKAACMQTFGEFDSDGGRLDKAVTDGLAVFDSASANLCLTEVKGLLATIPCNALFTSDSAADPDGFASCQATFTGTLDDGATCPVDEACKSGFCDRGSDGKSTCDGKCAPRGKDGASCYNGAGCADGLRCSSGKCAKPVTAGSVAAGSACEESKECSNGLVCASDNTGKVCTKPKAAGEACKDFEAVPCAEGLTCSEGKCAAGKKAGETCTPPPFPFLPSNCAAGLTCSGDKGAEKCLSPVPLGGACASDAVCYGLDTTCTGGKCTAVDIGGVGSGCVPKSKHKMGMAFGCTADVVCDPATSTCAAAPAVGAGCVEGECGKALRCAADDKCAALAKSGEDCDTDGDCSAGLTCSMGKCAAICS